MNGQVTLWVGATFGLLGTLRRGIKAGLGVKTGLEIKKEEGEGEKA